MDAAAGIAAALDPACTALVYREYASPYRCGIILVRNDVVYRLSDWLYPIIQGLHGDVKKLYDMGSLMPIHPDLIKLVDKESRGEYKGAPLRIPVTKLYEEGKKHVVMKR